MPNQAVEFHTTKQLLLDTVRVMFERENPGSITSEQVLAKARVSSGSLYHHFEDFPDLIEQALCAEYEQFTMRTVDLLLMANEQAKDIESWMVGVNEARRLSHGATYERNRYLRIWAVAYTSNGQRMRERLGAVQERLNHKWVEFMTGAQKAGWVIPEIDPLAYGVFVQSYALGSVINDFAPTQVEPEKWIALLERVSRRTAFSLD